MNKLTKALLSAVMLAGSAMSLAGCGSDAGAVYTPGTKVKVGLICLHNEASTYDKNFIDALDAAVKNLGDKVDQQTVIKTDVGENSECYDAARELVKQGCNVIFADSFGHEEFMMKAAQKWQNVTFCHATGTKAKTANIPNYHNAFASIYEGRYLAGYAAGLKLKKAVEDKTLSEKNYDADGNIKLGYIGAFEYAEVISGYTSWFLGVKSVVSNVVMDVTFTKSWYSINDEEAGAKDLITRGAALISQHADSMGAPGECEKQGVPNVSYNLALNEDCPNTYVAMSKIDWAPYYENVVSSLYEGKSIAGEVDNNYTGTLKSGSVKYDVADSALKTEVDKVKAELEAGTRKIFDCSTFTVKGEHLTSYKADVIDDGDFSHETEVIKTEGGKTFFDESSFRSAPYFDLSIDGITKLNSGFPEE